MMHDAEAWAEFFATPVSPHHFRFFATDEEIAAECRADEGSSGPALFRLMKRLLIAEPLSRA